MDGAVDRHIGAVCLLYPKRDSTTKQSAEFDSIAVGRDSIDYEFIITPQSGHAFHIKWQ